MKDFKGTQGNLRKVKSSRNKVEFSILREDGYQIALVESSYIGSDSETVANADLFIAAPKLLAACIEFVRKCDNREAKSVKSYAQMTEAINKALDIS